MGKIGKEQIEKDMAAYFGAITEKPILFVELTELEKPRIKLSVDNMIVLFLLDTYDLYSLFTIKVLVVPVAKNAFDNLDNDQSNTTVTYKSEVFFREVTTFINCSTITKDCALGVDEVSEEENGKEIRACKKPSVHLLGKNMHIAGLSAVLRFLLKFACRRHDMCENESTTSIGTGSEVKSNVEILDKLLGYQRGCLQACAESSIWTKFCEVDMIQTVHALEAQLLQLVSKSYKEPTDACLVDGEIPLSPSPQPGGLFELPKDLLRLEYHLTRPVRIHNFRKRIQNDEGKRRVEAGGNNQSRSCNHPPRHDDHEDSKKIRMNGQVQEQQEPHPGQISHDFAEGPDFTLADLLLFPCVDLVLQVLGTDIFKKYLPTVLHWHGRVQRLLPVVPQVTFDEAKVEVAKVQNVLRQLDVQVSEVPQESLYKSDPLRYKAKLRLFTKQDDIEAAQRFLSVQGIQAFNFNEDKMPPFHWNSLPHLVHPEGGQLPPRRIENKSHQLSNLALMVVKVFEDKYEAKYNLTGKKIRIVDFCSGGGHLGILLAYILPQCEVVLVENKEESLRRAESRVKILGLTNISFFQCNLDYFSGHFEIGVALHACGTATDLVLSKCVQMRASFVCCPCCYGAIQSNHMLHYPRSSTFLNAVNTSGGLFSLKHYFVLGHAADQTHDEANEKTQQGKFCMRMIDTDRCFHAQENNYDVFLRKMQPSTCSPKNHILVGVPA